MITNFLLTVSIISLLIVLHDIGIINKCLNKILKEGVKEETSITIDEEDWKKLVNLISDELEKRNE